MNTSTVQSLQVFDPAMCCSTGICGPEVDPKLARFAADLEWLKTRGVLVRRHNLSQDPAAFVNQEQVRNALSEKGEAALPLLLLNGQVALLGRYPDRTELCTLLKIRNDGSSPGPAAGPVSGGCCDGIC